MNKEELKKIIYNGDDLSDEYKCFIEDSYKAGEKSIINGVEFEVAHIEGGEGKGDHAEIVYKVDNELFAEYARYDSYNGFDWNFDGPWAVELVQKMITVYEPKK